MKKEARLLKQKSLNSLILSIEHFNRPWDHGSVPAPSIWKTSTCLTVVHRRVVSPLPG
jgi:hypothetical protein